MTIGNARILTVVGGLLLVLGIFLGLQKLEHGTTPCGSAFNPNVNLDAMTYLYDDADRAYCGDATGERQMVAVGLIVVGLVAASFGVYSVRRQEKATV